MPPHPPAARRTTLPCWSITAMRSPYTSTPLCPVPTLLTGSHAHHAPAPPCYVTRPRAPPAATLHIRSPPITRSPLATASTPPLHPPLPPLSTNTSRLVPPLGWPLPA